MEPDHSPTKRGRWPLGLLGMVAIVFGVESYVNRHALTYTETSRYSWTLSDSAAIDEARSASILCFGDSLVKHGLLPEVLETRLGRPVYNLAICAAPPPAHYFLLRHALEAGARPEAIVIDSMPGLLAGDLKHAEKYWAELLTIPEVVELALTSRDSRFLLATGLDRIFATNRARWEVRNSVVSALAGKVDPLAKTNLMHRRNWRIHRGAEFTQDNPAFDGEASEEDHTLHLSDRFWCNRLNRLYIDKLLTLAGSRGIRVYWLLPPASPRMQERRVASGADAKYTQFFRGLAAKYPRLVVLDARQSGFDHTKFVDPIHLTGKGALALSAEVADAIAADRGSWVELPRYRDRPFGLPLEELEQSRLAISAETLENLDSSRSRSRR